MANDPRAYRESIAEAIRELRPAVEVVSVEPVRLEEYIAYFAPDMVVCNRVTEAVRSAIAVWVELYPGNGSSSVASIQGLRRMFAEIQLSDLLSIVDETQRLAQKG